MIDLTDDFLRLRTGVIRHYPAGLDHPVAGTWTIQIPLEPFSAGDEFDPATFRPGSDGPELIETEIVLDFIELPADELAGLSRRTFEFPTKPEDGYIDGSIYLIAAHCAVEVIRIDFGETSADQITASLDARFDFDSAGGIGIHNRSAVLKTVLRFEAGQPA
ncbi:MAG: hypothetical protein ACRDOO_21575 [Actinomadura sp.]